MSDNFNETMKFQVKKDQGDSIEDIIKFVIGALEEKGYDPINQFIGFILSGDPTYITSHKDARSLICKVERDEILEELIRNYLA